jgi:hypothetical protein
MRSKSKLWKIKLQRRAGPWEERVESKRKVYEVYIPAEYANYQCGALPTPYLEVWVDERDGHGWCLYEVINFNDMPA